MCKYNGYDLKSLLDVNGIIFHIQKSYPICCPIDNMEHLFFYIYILCLKFNDDSCYNSGNGC